MRFAMPRRWTRDEFARSSPRLARALIGHVLVRVLADGTRLAGRIIETEAYLGVRDRAAHSFGGLRTARNEAMYAAPGISYVYFTYGMHHCFNVVCGEVDEPVAVLIRALEPTEGIEAMRRFRGLPRRRREGSRGGGDTLLTSGPARLCQAMRIDRRQNGVDLCRSSELFVEHPGGLSLEPLGRVVRTPRVGVERSGEWALKPYRFVVEGHPHASR